MKKSTIANLPLLSHKIPSVDKNCDRLCGLVVRVLGYRSGSPGSIPGITNTTSLVNTTEELLDRKVAAPV
jgi:hypothetical protein